MANGATEEERARFRQVVLPYLNDCYALARWLTGDRADAEDVVQDACLRALRAINGFSGNNARAWTLTIVRNTAYSWLAQEPLVRAADGRATWKRSSAGKPPAAAAPSPAARRRRKRP